VHGHGLYKSGLLCTAACANCHGAHAMYYTSDKRSPLYPANVAGTCGKCHAGVEQTLDKSIHGRGLGPGQLAEQSAPGGEGEREPSCTDCHQGHDLPDPREAAFRLSLRHRCGNCHPRHSEYYAMSVHGELTELGYEPAANCSDCHGAHSILPVSDPNSPLSPAHRLATCRNCHPSTYAASNFVLFDPHANYRDPKRDPVLYWVYAGLRTLLFTVFGFFGLHSLLWFLRSLVDVVKHGRPKGLVPGGLAFRRFRPFHRAAHTVMLLSFLGLALTGLPLKYSHYGWAKSLAQFLGGFESTGVWHRTFGVVLFGCLLSYTYQLLRRYRVDRRQGVPRRSVVFGPDSPMPTWRDVKDFARMNRWFLGLGPKPTFERWSYWEKFDFWGAVADTVIIGLTGLILWFPNQFCIFLPGSAINIAKVIHSTQALLATGFVFAIHFFNTHIRAEKFPADLSVLTGQVSEEEFREERPDYAERMRREGRLDELRGRVPSLARLWLYRLAGFVALGIGISLLVGMILAGLSK
jgi:cytochrome b subunit of formate dehydrogenase